MGVGGVGWNFHFGRILTSRDDLCISIPNSPEKYPVIETPDGKRQILYPATENTFDYITTSRWKIECILSSGGFLVHSPDGITYAGSANTFRVTKITVYTGLCYWPVMGHDKHD